MLRWIDGYFSWLSSGGFRRLAFGLLAPMFAIGVLVVGAMAGSEPTDDAARSTADNGSATQSGAAPADVIRPTEPPPTAIPSPTAQPYELALISANCTTSYGYRECEGYVKNLSGQNIEGLQVVIQWYDASGTPQSSDWSFVDYDPLLPGQDSPWSTFGTHNPELTRYRVEFKEFLGGTIKTRDDRPD